MDFDLRAGLAVLERTPQVLSALLADLPEQWTSNNEGAGTWSPFDVVGHLIDGEQTDWMARLHIILRQGQDRRFESFDRQRHISRNKGRALNDLLAEFRQLRENNLGDLRALNLSVSQLQLNGIHPEFGEVTLKQLLATWVAHDLAHLAQISRVMARQYRDAVGPWQAYLPVLHR